MHSMDMESECIIEGVETNPRNVPSKTARDDAICSASSITTFPKPPPPKKDAIFPEQTNKPCRRPGYHVWAIWKHETEPMLPTTQWPGLYPRPCLALPCLSINHCLPAGTHLVHSITDESTRERAPPDGEVPLRTITHDALPSRVTLCVGQRLPHLISRRS